MPTLILRFPGGRYHATPWGHHVNEGLVEWPPSPWRLLRALLSTGYTTLQWPAEGPPPAGRTLIEKLAAVLPRFRLPETTGSHSRHYMPMAVIDKGREKTTLVFDTWARIDGSDLAVTWDVDLTEDERSTLADLAGRLGYLGRSESWVVARLAAPDEALPSGFVCEPCDSTASPERGMEQTVSMAALPAEIYAQWRHHAVETELAKLPPVEPGKKPGKKVLAERQKAEAPYPRDLIDCLQRSTNDLREHGWSQPPGSRRVFYWCPADALSGGSAKSGRRPGTMAAGGPAVEAMLLSMSTESGNDHALPAVTRTLPQAEFIHRALVSIACKLDHEPPKVLTGKDEKRQKLQLGHRHAHILPLDLDGDGHIEHFLIWARMGLDSNAQRIIRQIRNTFTKNGMGPLKLAVVASGSLADLTTLSLDYGAQLTTLLGGTGRSGSREWVSLTPFVPPNFLKARGKNSLEGQIAEGLARCGLPQPETIEPMELNHPDFLRFRHYVRIRRSGAPPPVDCGFPIRLTFAEPISGPIALGYGCHFGLGLFTSVTPARP